MTTDEIKATILDSLKRIAPEIGQAPIDPHASFRDQLDLDSMDFLNFVLALHDRLGVDIPEVDYSKLSTLNTATSYLAARMNGSAVADRV